MITIVSPKIETKIEINPKSPLVLIIENPHEYFIVVNELNNALQGELSEFTFWRNIEQLPPNKYGEILLNCFSFDFCDKKIINLLYKKLQQNYLESGLIIDFNLINTNIGSLFEKLFLSVDFSLDYNEITLEDLLKICSVKPLKTYNTLLEKIVCYINIFIELKNVEFFIFIGLKEVLSDDDLLALYKHCELQKVALLLVESFKQRPLLNNEKAIIITDDLCEIVENI